MTYSKAKKVADRIVELLLPHCDIINIAGSVRREKPQVKDIEIVCLPKQLFSATDLFGGGSWQVSPDYIATIEAMTLKVVKGKHDGKYMQLVLKGEMILDLFTPSPEDYYRQFAIRTGSADYSAKIIAVGWRNIGWCGTHNAGLRPMRDCIETKSGWECRNLSGDKPPVWKSEQEFFEWIKIPWIAPRMREV